MNPDETDYLDIFLHHTPVALAIIRSLEAKLLSGIPLHPPELDVGCGDGLFAQLTFNRQLDTGIDISPTETRRAVRRGEYRHVICSSAAHTGLPDNHFQTVISNCVLEHIADPVTIFREIHRVMTPGGWYHFTAHSHHYEDFLYFTRLFRTWKMKPLADGYGLFIRKLFKHFSCLSPQHWQNLLEAAGFVDVHWKYYLDRPTLEAFDRYLFLSAPAFLMKKYTGRWVRLPRHYIVKYFKPKLEPFYHEKPDRGGALLLSARKSAKIHQLAS